MTRPEAEPPYLRPCSGVLPLQGVEPSGGAEVAETGGEAQDLDLYVADYGVDGLFVALLVSVVQCRRRTMNKDDTWWPPAESGPRLSITSHLLPMLSVWIPN